MTCPEKFEKKYSCRTRRSLTAEAEVDVAACHYCPSGCNKTATSRWIGAAAATPPKRRSVASHSWFPRTSPLSVVLLTFFPARRPKISRGRGNDLRPIPGRGRGPLMFRIVGKWRMARIKGSPWASCRSGLSGGRISVLRWFVSVLGRGIGSIRRAGFFETQQIKFSKK